MKFNIYAGLKGQTEFIEEVEVDSKEIALKIAEYHAYDVYYINPPKDVMDIMRDEDVNEDIAHILFITKMVNSVDYRVEEVMS